MKPAFIVIDMQRFFYDRYHEVFCDKLVPNIKAALSMARSSNVPAIHVVTRYSKDKSDWPKTRRHRDHIKCLEGAKDAQILPHVQPLPGEHVVVKTRFSGFYNSSLDSALRELGADTLFIAGFASDVCVRFTTIDAYNRDYDLFLLEDCVHAVEDTEASIQYLQWLTNLTVVSNKELPYYWPLSGGDAYDG